MTGPPGLDDPALPRLLGAKKAEAVLPKAADGPNATRDTPQTSQGKEKPRRAVLVIVTEWPSGTMAIKFGSAMKRARG